MVVLQIDEHISCEDISSDASIVHVTVDQSALDEILQVEVGKVK